ncbi:hypothetical protein PoB_000540000 [Plakobranchus ocellatus]|uniref:Uncharacterized protein n=1 Tax=Plakobranchus ocellatus TaxID=259542 RepID=A0AAV3Y8S2_9GAST|nr:hypothetical protein PoB_000540000 [Plakobranchus ocellatus]
MGVDEKTYIWRTVHGEARSAYIPCLTGAPRNTVPVCLPACLRDITAAAADPSLFINLRIFYELGRLAHVAWVNPGLHRWLNGQAVLSVRWFGAQVGAGSSRPGGSRRSQTGSDLSRRTLQYRVPETFRLAFFRSLTSVGIS